MNIKNQLSTAAAGGSQLGSGLRRTLCLLALVAFYAVGAKADVAINATNFPDANFRNWVLAQDYGADGKLTDAEIAGVTTIDVHYKSISVLKGIEYFTALKTLKCYDNKLTSLDVSKNTVLTELWCYENKLTSLDVSKNKALTYLRCYRNQLTSLDVSKNTALKDLDCSDNQLTSLDVSGCTALKVMICYGNQLTSLDVSKNKALTDLLCYNNQIRGAGMATLINSLPEVTNSIFAVYDSEGTEGNEITTVQVAAAEKKGWDVLTSVGDDYPGVPGIAIDATNFPDENFRTYVSSNFDTDKDTYLSDDEIAAVTKIAVSGRNITDLKGIEYFTALTDLYCFNNQLTSLDVSKNTALRELNCHSNQLTALDVSKNTALWYLYCYNNQLTSLDVSKSTALKTLECGRNQLTSLDVSKNTALKKLYCNDNQLTSLDVSKNTALTSLNCNTNQLTTLDVSKNTALTSLSCADNQLTSLDVSKNTALEYLYCNSNQLTALDVSRNTALEWLFCQNNQLASLDVSKNKALTLLYCENNQIRGADMATLVENLPTVTNGSFYAYNTDGTDGNRITTVQVAAAKAKGWIVWTSSGFDYPGVDPGIAIDATNFPDGNFRAYVSSNCDTDGDTYLSDDEIAAVTFINVSEKSITNLKGIEYFTVLTELWCNDNKLTSLDVSKNTALTYLDCHNNQLTSLDVSKNTALEYLYCYYNQLTSLDVSKNTALTWLACENNQIQGAGMAKLVNSLLEVTNGSFYVYNTDGTEGNEITTVQVAAAKAKHWNVKTIWGDDYPGVDIPGDANGDGEVNAQDVDCLRDYILGLDPQPFSLESANLNDDGEVDIQDLTQLIQLLTE